MISVIVPVYNVENYIRKCIDSILKQTYSDYELILVDDGSTDSSSNICKEYKFKHSNIQLIEKPNGGLSDARNAGVAVAKGQYITFIDSDDYVNEDYLKVLYSNLIRYKADISVIELFKTEDRNEQHKKGKKTIICSGEEAMQRMLYQKGVDTSACGILIDTKIVRKFSFPYGKYHEDDFITFRYYASAQKVVISSATLYYYFQRSDSIMKSISAVKDELDAADYLVETIKKDYPHYIKAAQSKQFSNYCQVIIYHKGLKQTEPQLYQQIVSTLMKLRRGVLFDKNTRLKNKAAAALLLFGDNGFLKISGFLGM